jgi:phage shock protein A
VLASVDAVHIKFEIITDRKIPVKQSIFARVAQLAKANLNSLLDSAEDPQKMLDQMVRDYSENIREAESAIAQTIGNLRMAEEDHARAVSDANTWGSKAIAASRKADEFRAAGNSVDADKFDALAKVAIGRQMTAESTAKAQEPNLAAQNQVVDKLKQGLDQMRGKLRELTGRWRPDLGDRPVRGEHPAPGSHRPWPAGTCCLITGRPIRLARRPRGAD